jgi:hypothetical protein
MKSINHRVVLTGLIIGLASVVGCSGGSGSTDNGAPSAAGMLGMELQIAPGVTINTINWTITNSATGFSQSGAVNVQYSNAIRFQIGNLPNGDGYAITLTGTSVDGSLVCSGSADFSVVSGATTAVNLTLVCTGAASDAGTIVVNGSTQVCANIQSISASPLETTVDGPVTLSATASAGSVTPVFAWTATAGTFDNPSSATPIFTCPSTPSVVTITLNVTPSAPICATQTSQSVEVTCGTLDPTFANVYANVIGVRCTGCHRPGAGGSNVGMLDMSTPAVAYANLVGVLGSGTGAGTSGVTCASLEPRMLRVSPGDSASSLLFNKVNSKLVGTLAACGSPMPTPATGAPLRLGQVTLIKSWIDSGALNN